MAVESLCWRILAKHLPKLVYRFRAERPISEKASGTPQTILNPNASNLPQVLRTLDGADRGKFRQYLTSVQSVYPEIRNIRMPGDSGSMVEVTLEYFDSEDKRPEWDDKLSDCGSGLGQVMAMLYVVVTSTDSRVIIIDEPNSFLHSGAIRNLLKVFQKHSHHQYILATHSPTAIMSVQKKQILLVKRENRISKVESVDVNDNTELENALKKLGTKRSDIFGMDAVIWVEGKTDETCFKMIMEQSGGLPFGTNIQSLINTGDIEDKKHAKLAVAIYQNLSGGVGLLPSVLAFVFDGDKDGAHTDIEDNHSDLISYLPRQTYENYLIEFPSIIADVLNERHTERTQEYTEAQVEQWIAGNRIKEKYYADGIIYDEQTWLSYINGAKFIKNMFWEMSSKGRTYKKVQFGEEIAKRILAQNPNHFQEIVDLIISVLPEGNLSNST